MSNEEDIVTPKGIRLMLKWPKLTSVNKLYVRTRSGIAVSPEARLFKSEVTKQVRAQIPKDLPFGRDDVFKLSLHFIIKERFFTRDTSNFVKLIEDTIFDELGINDARNIVLDCRKSLLLGSENEYVKVTVEKSDFNYNYFNETEDESEPGKGLDLEDKMYTKEEVEQFYARGLFDSLTWHLSQELKVDKDKPKKKPIK